MDKLAIINRVKRSYQSIRIAGIHPNSWHTANWSISNEGASPRHASTDDISRCPVCSIND